MKQINSNAEQEKLRKFFIKSGVKMVGPETIFFSKDTKIGKNVTINPYVVIGKKVKIGNNVTINSFSHLEDCKIKNKVEVGPYARLRPGTILEEGSRIGNFVEVKKSIVGKKSKINHLSYIGDSEIGKDVNVGAGTITCNYDGVKKSKTKIKDNVFIGSNSSLVAPVTLEKNSIVGAGSVITKKVKIGNNVIINSFSHLEDCKIKNKVEVGPYARLRPGTILEEGSKIGNFVEIKKSTIGKKSKVNHLSYIGDSELGRGVNVGAGTITCNYDGVKKSKTKIKDNVFIGSNSSLIAPVTLDANSIVGAGSVITKNVKKNSLALTRAPQTEVKNYKRRKK